MIGQTISHYRILEKLGEGGMGVVYKAQDTKLDRLVALKFLPPSLAASEQDKARFVQEAKAAAALNHPNVCSVIDIQEHDDSAGKDRQMFIVMEFVDGQTLREKGTTIPFKQAIEIGIQLSEGLAAAHEKGIVHRDIKPENVMVRKDGRVQIMDFGLAKLRGASRITKEGSTIGTVGYMSPEQVQGQEADHRTDIYSLGVLLYELVGGQSPYKGVHETAIMYEIVNEDPLPLSSIKTDIDADLDAMILDCMAKEPADRVQSAAELARNLRRFKRESSRQRVSRITSTRQPYEPTTRRLAVIEERGGMQRFLWPASAALLLILTAVAFWAPWRSVDIQANQPVVRFSITLPQREPLKFDIGLGANALAISPDGKWLVYASRQGAASQLKLRAMDQFSVESVIGSDGALDPFFSPNSQWIAFFAQGKLKKVSVHGGSPQDICAVPGLSRGGCWGNDGSLYFGHIAKGLQRVTENGRAPETIAELDSVSGEISQRFPDLLPGRKGILFTSKPNNISSFDEANIVVKRFDTGERKAIIRGGTFARYVPTGHIVYARGKFIYAAAFDLRKLEVMGPPVALVEGGMTNQGSGSSNFTFSNTGTFVYAPGGPLSLETNVIVWVDRRGKILPLINTPKPYADGKISPDGQKLAVDIQAANDDIWVYHVVRGTLTRLTFGGGNNNDPLWTPDGKRVLYSAERGGQPNLYWKAWDGSGGEERLTTSPRAQTPSSFSPDGKSLAYVENGSIWIYSVDERESRPFLESSFQQRRPVFSPDGRWIAYVSNESGRDEVYVVPYPRKEGKWQISTGGGFSPTWSSNGRELFYLDASNVMVVEVIPGQTLNVSTPRFLFELPEDIQLLDRAPDNQKFLGVKVLQQNFTADELHVVLGWFDEIKKKFAGVN